VTMFQSWQKVNVEKSGMNLYTVLLTIQTYIHDLHSKALSEYLPADPSTFLLTRFAKAQIPIPSKFSEKIGK